MPDVGSLLALGLCARHPRRVRSLVISNSRAHQTFQKIGVFVGGMQTLGSDLGIIECFAQRLGTKKRSFYDLQPLADFARLPIYSARQGSDERSDSVNYYNPELIHWLFHDFLPKPSAQLAEGLTCGQVYGTVFRPGVRVLAGTYAKLRGTNRYEALLKRYQAGDQRERFAIRSEFKNFVQDDAFDGDDYKFHSGHAVAFWMRRGMDGSSDAVWEGLLTLLDQYDPSFRGTLALP